MSVHLRVKEWTLKIHMMLLEMLILLQAAVVPAPGVEGVHHQIEVIDPKRIQNLLLDHLYHQDLMGQDHLHQKVDHNLPKDHHYLVKHHVPPGT
ncbi:unnamed protein product, partial [Iphiclides podalirius]